MHHEVVGSREMEVVQTDEDERSVVSFVSCIQIFGDKTARN